MQKGGRSGDHIPLLPLRRMLWGLHAVDAVLLVVLGFRQLTAGLDQEAGGARELIGLLGQNPNRQFFVREVCSGQLKGFSRFDLVLIHLAGVLVIAPRLEFLERIFTRFLFIFTRGVVVSGHTPVLSLVLNHVGPSRLDRGMCTTLHMHWGMFSTFHRIPKRLRIVVDDLHACDEPHGGLLSNPGADRLGASYRPWSCQMNSALSPREIQTRLRAGASVPEVAAEAGVEVDRIEGFALPVMAERAHMTRTALGSSVRRRGDGSGHRRLGEIVRERLQARSLDADTVEWDAWRQNDLKWRLVGLLDDQAASRAAEFVFDPKGRFSIADNADARWMIGETMPGPRTDPDNENTIDFNDELALVRAVSDGPSTASGATGAPGDEVPPHDSQYGGAAHTSELDELYDMLSGVSEDSVRIYLGLDDAEGPEHGKDAADDSTPDEDQESTDDDDVASAPSLSGHSDSQGHDGVVDEAFWPTPSPDPTVTVSKDRVTDEDAAPEDGPQHELTASDVASTDESMASGQESDGSDKSVTGTAGGVTPDPSPAAPEQDPLVPDMQPSAPKRKPAKKRASIPSWDEIMFGGPSPN